MKEITKQELIELLRNLKTATPTTIITSTVPKMRKKNNPYLDKVTKFMKANVFINFNYTNSVNKTLDKEGKETDFVASPRVWGTKIPGTPLIEHNGNYYLECRFLKHVDTTYIFENENIPESMLNDFLQGGSNAEHQGVSYENEVIVRDFKIESILEIRLMGEIYSIKQGEVIE